MTQSILTLPMRLTPVCSAILCLCVASWLLMLIGGPGLDVRMTYGFGLIPGVLTGQFALRPDLLFLPPFLTLVTSLFLHGGLVHLAGNMLFLWAVGRPLELVLGGWWFVALFLLSGIAGGLAETVITAPSASPVIGASGAISGVFAAYLMLFAIKRSGPIQSPLRQAISYLSLWLVLQAGMALVIEPTMGSGGIAIWAHVGGFVMGLILALFAVRLPRRS
jgi:membrane associated rhomboid family serine protease